MVAGLPAAPSGRGDGAIRSLGLAAALFVLPACAGGGASPDELDGRVIESDAHSFRIEVVATGFEHPWGLAFLPDGRALVTERPGRLNLVDPASGNVREIGGVPAVSAVGQGGLLDVALHPDFPARPWVYLTWAGVPAGDGGHATHLGRGRLDTAAGRLDDVEVLHVATPASTGTGHFGSRIVFDHDGFLYMTSGDRRSRDSAQDLASHRGKTLRFTMEGEIPGDNPFVDNDDALDAIYSYGHRNAQGMAVHPRTGAVWQSEHGPRSGDEINRIERGADFGWPDATYGREYSDGSAIGVLPPDDPDSVDPVYYWEDHSFAPSGLAFHDADEFPGWRGDAFVGSLARTNLTRLVFDGDDVIVGEEALLDDEGLRIRDVRSGPDGALHLLVDAAEAPWLRLVPVD